MYYDAEWYENAARVEVYDGSTKIAEGANGSVVWQPDTARDHEFNLLAYSNGGATVGQMSVTRSFSHIEVVTTAAKEPTCTEPGWTKDSYCSRCNAVLSTLQAIPVCHVEVVTTAAKAATCTEPGWTKDSYCGRCNAVLSTSQPIAALGHSGAVTKAEVAPTSATAGSTAEIRCSRCGELLQSATIIPALGYIRNVTARQLWPHKKVEVCYTVAEDIGDMIEPSSQARIVGAVGGTTYSARTLIGDATFTPGKHHIVWDMESDGVAVSSSAMTFQVTGGVCEPGFVTKSFYQSNLSFDKTSDVWSGNPTVVNSPSQLYATSLAEHTTVAYGCYMQMTAGVTYLNSQQYCILHWLAVLLENRQFETEYGLPSEAKEYLCNDPRLR